MSSVESHAGQVSVPFSGDATSRRGKRAPHARHSIVVPAPGSGGSARGRLVSSSNRLIAVLTYPATISAGQADGSDATDF